jgi:hypothetical protein
MKGEPAWELSKGGPYRKKKGCCRRRNNMKCMGIEHGRTLRASSGQHECRERACGVSPRQSSPESYEYEVVVFMNTTGFELCRTPGATRKHEKVNTPRVRPQPNHHPFTPDLDLIARHIHTAAVHLKMVRVLRLCRKLRCAGSRIRRRPCN